MYVSIGILNVESTLSCQCLLFDIMKLAKVFQKTRQSFFLLLRVVRDFFLFLYLRMLEKNILVGTYFIYFPINKIKI